MNDKPNIPKYYRLLEKGEAAQKEDIDATWETWDNSGGLPRRHIWHNFLRPVIVDPWIEYAKQKPTKEDFEPTGMILVLRNDTDLPLTYYTTDLNVEHLWNFPNAKPQFWLRITPPQPAKPKSVTVYLKTYSGQSRKIEVNADGTANASCGEKFSAESIDAFIKARQEITKKDL